MRIDLHRTHIKYFKDKRKTAKVFILSGIFFTSFLLLFSTGYSPEAGLLFSITNGMAVDIYDGYPVNKVFTETMPPCGSDNSLIAPAPLCDNNGCHYCQQNSTTTFTASETYYALAIKIPFKFVVLVSLILIAAGVSILVL